MRPFNLLRSLKFCISGFSAVVLVACLGCESSEVTVATPNAEMAADYRNNIGSKPAVAEETTTQGGGGTGWGTLKGTFVYDGPAPARTDLSSIVAAKEKSCASHKVLSKELIVDEATGGIANVVIFARKVNRIHDDLKTSEETPVFDQDHCEFLSHVKIVPVGVPVEVKNSDMVGHNTNTSPFGDESLNSAIAVGGSLMHTFKKEQKIPVPVICNIHPWMKAYIFPRADPYARVTDPKGSFNMEEVPAGEQIEFQLWHEKVGYLEIPGWKKGRKKLTVPADGELDLGTIKISPSVLN